jgi:hypothetical protein
VKSEIELVLEIEGKSFNPLCDHEWLYDFAVCTDITQHTELNVGLQVAILLNEKKPPGLSPPANYTDRATAACRRS